MPAVHRFPLQPVLNVKSSLVDVLKMEFARLQRAYQVELDKLLALQTCQTQSTAALQQQQQNGPLDCTTIQLHQQYLKYLADTITRQADQTRQAEGRVEAKRTELVKTVQDQKTLEKLRERHEVKERLELNRREAGIVDDLVTTRYARER